MLHGLQITIGERYTPLVADKDQWLVEARVEMELSKATRFALRFEDDICEGKHEIFDADIFTQHIRVALFAVVGNSIECLVSGPITKIKSSSVLGGQGSWVEVHGEDRRSEMNRTGIQATYEGLASAIVAKILTGYKFKPSTQDTLIKHDKQKLQLTQSGTDLAFIEDVARRNNMEFWIDYKVNSAKTGAALVEETANFRTSPHRSQTGDTPALPVLSVDLDRILFVHPPGDRCTNITKFDTRIDFEKPTAAFGFTLDDAKERKLIDQLVKDPPSVGGDRVGPFSGAVERKMISPPESSKEEAFLAKDALVNESSWFVEADCSATLDQVDFIARPHQIVTVSHAGPGLSGPYQVMKATHVITATDHLMDFTLRANGLKGGG
jgi:hypothetical protein